MTSTLIIYENKEEGLQLGNMLKNIVNVYYCNVEESALPIVNEHYELIIIHIPLAKNIDRVLQLIVLAKEQSAIIVTAKPEENNFVYRCFENGVNEVLTIPLHEELVKLRVLGIIKQHIDVIQNTTQHINEECHKYYWLFENMNADMIVLRIDGEQIIIENINHSTTTKINYSKPEVIGKPVKDIMPDIHNLFAKTILNVADTGQSVRIEKNVPSIDKYLSFNIYRTEPHIVALVIQDLTEKRIAEKQSLQLSYQIKKQYKDLDNKAYELAKAKKQLELFLESSNDGTWDYNPTTDKLTVNMQYLRQFKYNENETEAFTKAEDFLKILYDQETKQKYLDNFKNIMAGKIDLINEELKIKCKDGSTKWIVAKCIAKHDENGKTIRIAGVNTDITERKKYEETLNSKSEELQKANDTKNMFISIIAHDLRNPFNAIIGLTDILLKRPAINNDPRTKEIASIILQSAKTTYEMLNNILLWCRSQQNTIAFEPNYYNIHKTIDEALGEVKGQAQKKRIMLINNTSTDDTIWCDNQMLQTIIRNLAVNSVKFTNEGGLITVTTEQTPEYSNIIVEDNGIGMSQETIDKLLIIEKNRSTEGTAGEQGSGMGLLIVNEFIKRHKGYIKIESQVGKGSKFILSFPSKP